MATVIPEDLDFRSFDGFVSFLQDKLNWPIKEEISKESLTYEFLPEELRIEEKQLRRLKDDSIYQLIPFTEEQPWGIFLLELNTPRVYTTFLRQILHGLVPSRRKPSDLPTWQLENLLFICTCNYKDFTFAHFKGEKYQKAKLSTFSWTAGETRLRTLCEFNLPPLFYNEEFKYNPKDWLTEWSKAFDKEKLTKEFFEAYKFALQFIKDRLKSQNKAEKQKIHSYAQQLLSRIMFLYFVAKKDWLKWKDYSPDKNYVGNLWVKYKKYKNENDTFYSHWLSMLFFKGFQGPSKHTYIHNNLNLPSEIIESFVTMPFLNGGLFTPNKLDEIEFKLPDEIFELLFEIDDYDKRKGFLERYNFTIREDTPFEVEVAVDPEMLGKVYESLISEEERGKAGIFYTPRIEIDFMCKLSLVMYLAEKTEMQKSEIIRFVFEPQAIREYSNAQNLRMIKSALDKVKVVDPAVGSASFLVGMMNVLVELHRYLNIRLEKAEGNLFELKKMIISKNLYGVDVKDWAIMVGELRLWLSLIIDTDEKELKKLGVGIAEHPLLPNLSFKIRQGDSLVEEIISDTPFSLRAKFAYMPQSIKDKISQLIDRKITYFGGRISANLKEKIEIENLENEIFKEIVSDEIIRLKHEENKLQTIISAPGPKQVEMFRLKPEQKDLFEKEMQKQKEKLREIEREKARLKKLFAEIGKKKSKDYFLWEIDFAEVFAEKDGFDIVIGNPPYVRQEKIAFPLEKEEDFKDEEEWKARKRLYKEKLVNSVRMNWGNFININKRSDLYVYFYYAGLSLLHPDGVFCFINSNSWLDVKYGAGLQEFLLKNMEPIYVIDNQAKRSFKESDINTVIVAIKRLSTPYVIARSEATKQSQLKFVAFKKPFEDALTSDNLIKIEQSSKIKSTEHFRVFPITRKQLLKDGVESPEKETLLKDPEHLPYIGNKWGGKYLQAPDILFKILQKGKNKLVRLGDIAEVRFGIKTGANEFFYLEPTGKPAPKELVHVKNGAGWEGFIEKEFLKPVIKSPREVKSILLKTNQLPFKIFMCHKPKEDLTGSGALRYIKWGEELGFHERPTCQQRQVNKKSYFGWYDLGIREKYSNICPQIINDFMRTILNGLDDNLVYASDVVLNITYQQKIDLCCSMNSTLTQLFVEQEGRIALGEGALKIQIYEAKKIYILNPKYLSKIKTYDLIKTLSIRETKGIFEELGLPKPNRDYSNIDPADVSLNKVMPDRRELDKIIFDVLGLNEDEQLEVYSAVIDLVKNRLVKARSV